MLRDVGSAEAVDRVVGHEPGRDEVVRALDVEVVHRPLEFDALDRLDDVVAPVLGEHRHARADRCRRHERQRVLHAGHRRTEPRRVAHRHLRVFADAIGEARRPFEVLEARLDLPAPAPPSRTEIPSAFQRGAHLRVAPAHRHPVHRRLAAPVPAQRDGQVAPPALMRRGRVVWTFHVQARVVHQPEPGLVRVDAREDAVDQRLAADKTVPAPGDEGDRWQPIGHVQLGRQPSPEPCEVGVLRRRDDLAAAARADTDTPIGAVRREGVGDACGAHVAAAVYRSTG